MTNAEIKKFYEHHVEWYANEIVWDSKQIAYYTEQLARSRKEDREFVEWIQQNPNYTDEEKARYKGHASKETKEYIAYRNKYYANRRKDTKSLAKYKKELANLH